jgi:hypothetical protein
MQKTKQVGKYTVYQTALLEEMRMRAYLRNFVEQKSGDVVEDEVYKEAYDDWAYTAACIKPYIPFDEWATIPTLERVELVKAVNEVNTEIVEFGQQQQPSKKKKQSAPPKSTND